MYTGGGGARWPGAESVGEGAQARAREQHRSREKKKEERKERRKEKRRRTWRLDKTGSGKLKVVITPD